MEAQLHRVWRRRWESNPRIRVLQTLPLATWVRRLVRTKLYPIRYLPIARGGEQLLWQVSPPTKKEGGSERRAKPATPKEGR